MGGVEERDIPLSAYKQTPNKPIWQNLLRKQCLRISPGANERVCLLCPNDTGNADYRSCLNLELLLGQEFAVGGFAF